MKVIIGSKNPAKIKATKTAFGELFKDIDIIYEGISVPSGVSDQPMDDEETLRGSINRAKNAKEAYEGADFRIGLEGGIEQLGEDMISFARITIMDNKGKIGKGKTGTLFLPHKVKELIHDGYELGDADDIVFGKSNSKHDLGAVGILTKGNIDRCGYYALAVKLALIPFINEELY